MATVNGEYDEHADREGINAVVANEMSDLRSDDADFEPSQFHRTLRDLNRVYTLFIKAILLSFSLINIFRFVSFRTIFLNLNLIKTKK